MWITIEIRGRIHRISDPVPSTGRVLAGAASTICSGYVSNHYSGSCQYIGSVSVEPKPLAVEPRAIASPWLVRGSRRRLKKWCMFNSIPTSIGENMGLGWLRQGWWIHTQYDVIYCESWDDAWTGNKKNTNNCDCDKKDTRNV